MKNAGTIFRTLSPWPTSQFEPQVQLLLFSSCILNQLILVWDITDARTLLNDNVHRGRGRVSLLMHSSSLFSWSFDVSLASVLCYLNFTKDLFLQIYHGRSEVRINKILHFYGVDFFIIDKVERVTRIVSTGSIGFSKKKTAEGFPGRAAAFRCFSESIDFHRLCEQSFDSRNIYPTVLWGSMLRCSHDSRPIHPGEIFTNQEHALLYLYLCSLGGCLNILW